MSVVRLVTTQAEPRKRACGTCRHAPIGITTMSICQATGNYIELERRHGHNACGSSGALWEVRPPNQGLIGRLKSYIFGD
jgi:hypothetical protein